MAAYLNPLTESETADLTLEMAASGARVDLTGLPKPWVDKHSTGGVGDKTSIVLLPLLAACGLTIVKMSGAGLGVTGGTVDKLSSIPGFRLDLSIEELKEQAKRIGVALTGQTPELAPADKALYALRDVTATVRSIPLIVSSILSKKIAGGAELVVIDVKCGSGAFMRNLDEAEELAGWLVRVGERCGLKVKAAITDMDQPLGSAVGNALEVAEALHLLAPHSGALSGPTQRFFSLCTELAVEVLITAGLFATEAEARQRVEAVVASRVAEAKASQWISSQGGPPSVQETLKALPIASVQRRVMSDRAGWIQRIAADEVGAAVVDLGGGRRRKGDPIDPAVGVLIGASVGEEVRAGETLFEVHARTEDQAQMAEDRIRSAITFSDEPVESRPLILRKL